MPTIVPFTDDHLDAAGRLLAERHRAHRRVEAGLDARYEDPAAAGLEIEALLRQEGASGIAALADDEVVVGFLIGTRRDASWGPNVWVEPAGHAATDPEVVRDLYAAAAQGWVVDGRTSHYAMVPATDPALVDAWFRLGFGHQHVHAIRETPNAPTARPAPNLELRVARRGDLDALARLGVALPEHQVRSPVFSSLPLPSVESTRAEYEEDFDDPRFTTFVAERDGEVIGSTICCALEVSSSYRGLALAPDAAFLGFAAVLTEARGSGAGRLLGEAVLDWARETGRPTVVADWRMTNLLASRAWPRLGFRPMFYRLFRAIPPA